MEVAYLTQIREALAAFDPERSNRYFVFGSAVRSKKFRDIDVGVIGNKKTRKPLRVLRDIFYDAPIPYKIDVVDMDAADEDFQDHVFDKERIVWI